MLERLRRQKVTTSQVSREEGDLISISRLTITTTMGRRIPLFALGSTIASFILLTAFINQLYNDASESARHTCSIAVETVSENVKRTTEQVKNVVTSIGAWLEINPDTDFKSDVNLFALSTALNVDPMESFAIAVIRMNGDAYLLDRSFMGKVFNISARPYFDIVKKMPINSVRYGPRVANVNTKQETVAIFRKIIFNEDEIVVSTAFSAKRLDQLMDSALPVESGNVAVYYGEKRIAAYPSDYEFPSDIRTNLVRDPRLGSSDDARQVLPVMVRVGDGWNCSKGAGPDGFIVFSSVAIENPLETHKLSVVGLAFLTIISALATFFSYRLVFSLVNDLRDERESLVGAQKQLSEALREATSANETKSEFLAAMSHELRTPLNAVIGYGQMLEMDPEDSLSDKQREYLSSVVSGGNHLLKLVNEILDLSEIEADHIVIEPDLFDPTDEVLNTLQYLELFAKEREISIALDQASWQSETVWSDKQRFRQILINFISNAIKYNHAGGRVKISNEIIPDQFMKIVVSDTGIGISKEVANRIFSPFVRNVENAMHTADGLGIGLSVSKSLAERLGGRIGFESVEGNGSSFWLEIPLSSNQGVLIWTEDLRVGVDAIDRDHQTIFALTNRMSHPEIDHDEMARVVEQMIEYTSYHFRREEAIMESCRYPQLERHMRRHAGLEKYVRKLAREWEGSDDPEALLSLRSFLRNWWITHINDVDTTITKFALGHEAEISRRLAAMED